MENYKKPTAREVRDYLNYLTEFKKKIEFPMNMEIESGVLYHIYNGSGNRVATFSKEVYDVFQEL